MVLTVTPDISSEQTIICNEFCDIGRHTMLGKIHATEGATSAEFLGTCPESGLQFHKYEGSIPLVTFGALTACIIAVFTIASGAIILIPTYLWSIGYINHIDPAMYRLIWWAPGHSSQPINVAAHVAVWYAVAAIVSGARPLSEKVSRTAFFLYIAFLQLVRAHHLLVDCKQVIFPGLVKRQPYLSVFFAKPVDSESAWGFTASRVLRAEPIVVPGGDHAAAGKWGLATPGTLRLAIFFLLIFVIYYGVNRKYLASVWPIS